MGRSVGGGYVSGYFEMLAADTRPTGRAVSLILLPKSHKTDPRCTGTGQDNASLTWNGTAAVPKSDTGVSFSIQLVRICSAAQSHHPARA